MSVDPNIDFSSHDPHDRDEPSDDPRIREVQALEAKMREALATKENPLHDDESTSDRLAKAGFNEAPDGADPRGDSREERATDEDAEEPSGE